ncbi:AsmA family protein [Vibrio sp. SS-MA-C1-2]|uniref:AsmA family protein n=1 Tax=Vibrio sp. SS-MA-C1-2 TaxID=2908646 RepID=UPI001F39AF34|nr:AsmA family protein [Vibrio sp. SS-MA-C1-2]UJF19438.1 AsmA family protein [Vibrio sp. SS-MA-C1-2]
MRHLSLFIIKLISSLLIIATLFVSLTLALFHTSHGLPALQWVIKEVSSYQLHADSLDYNIEDPLFVELENPILIQQKSDNTEQSIFASQQLRLWFSTNNLWQKGWHFDSILIKKIDLTANESLNLPFSLFTKRLAITDANYQSNHLSLEDVKLELDDWSYHPNSHQKFTGDFRLSAEKGTWKTTQSHQSVHSLPNQSFTQLLIDGHHQAPNSWDIPVLSLQLERSSITAALSVFDKNIKIEQLNISDLQLNHSLYYQEIKSNLDTLGYHWSIKQLDMLNASLSSSALSFSSANISIGNLQSLPLNQQTLSLSFNSSDLAWKDWQLLDPLFDLTLKQGVLDISGASAKTKQGFIQLSGSFKDQHAAMIRNLTINGLRWTLPTQWRKKLTSLSNQFNRVSIDKLNIANSLFVDPNPQLPFQVTALNLSGENLILKKENRWRLWQGNLMASAPLASYNKVDLRGLSLSMTSQQNMWNNQFSMAFEQGFVDITSNIDLNHFSEPTTIDINGSAIPLEILTNWFNLPLPITGELDIAGALSGLTGDRLSFNYSLDGQLNGEVRDLMLPKTDSKKLSQLIKAENESVGDQQEKSDKSISTMAFKATPWQLSVYRGRLHIPQQSLESQDKKLALSFNADWDLAQPKSTKAELILNHWQQCQQLSRYWTASDSDWSVKDFSANECKGNSK